ncbi:hypothetical protein K490DRAFT_23455, partial [Saccharata proteae CBS 121410]
LTRPPPSRTFLPNPFSAFTSSDSSSSSAANVQTLTATRTLPYKSSDIYNIIADVSAYSSFLPYCQASKVTKWSQPDAQSGTRWPSEATLVVGWQNISEEFSSRIYCVPGRIVEAVSGGSVTQLKAEEIAHHNESNGSGNGKGNGSESLVDEFMTPESRPEQTQVSLAIEFAFANPLYATMSAAVAPKVAGMMIEAFEKRVETLLDG